MTVPTAIDEDGTITLDLRAVVDLSDEAFLLLCAENSELRLERAATGEIVIMAPAGLGSSHRNAMLTAALYEWTRADGTGVAFDSSAGFHLPDGAVLSPDGAWVRREHWAALSPTERRGFAPLCPDFVVELRSPTDRLGRLQAKMDEYLVNGVRLGWLIDPEARVVYVYRPGQPVVRHDDPATLSGGPELPGFTLDLAGIWRSLD